MGRWNTPESLHRRGTDAEAATGARATRSVCGVREGLCVLLDHFGGGDYRATADLGERGGDDSGVGVGEEEFIGREENARYAYQTSTVREIGTGLANQLAL